MVIADVLPSSVRHEPAPDSARTGGGIDRLGICAECGRAELFAVQPYARCLSAAGPFAGRTVFAGQRVCTAMTSCGDNLRTARRGIIRALRRGRDARAASADEQSSLPVVAA
jgi:hypothetical protein